MARGISNVDVLGVSDAGVVALNDSTTEQVYLYSPHRHRLYRPVKDARGLDFTRTGQLLLMTPAEFPGDGSGVSYLTLDTTTGASHTLDFTLPGGDVASSTYPNAINAAGEVVGERDTYHPPPANVGLGSYLTYVAAARDPATGQTVALATPDGVPAESTNGTPPLLNENGVIARGNWVYASPTAQPTQLPDVDEGVEALSNTFAVGQTTTNGIFIYDLASGEQTVRRFPRGVSFSPTAVNDDGIVVGILGTYQRVNRHVSYKQAAGAYIRGKFFNLNALTTLPAGVTLTEATAINSAGQIVAATGPFGGAVPPNSFLLSVADVL
jgi:hypothetical protein